MSSPDNAARDARDALRARWPLAGLDDVREELLAAYGDPRRGYHDLRHLSEVLDRIEELGRHETFDRSPVVLAAWFHDAVYEGAADDEERSARWAESALAGRPDGAEVAEVAEVVRLVRLTADHRTAADDANGAALCDADLAILAAPVDRYAAYVADVRGEYAHVGDVDFARGRAAVLRALIAGPLFATAWARSQWALLARANVDAELAMLDAASGR